MKAIFSYVFFIFMTLACFEKSYAQKNDPVSKIKVVFIYNFTKYIDWPASYKEGEFVIGLFGGSELEEELVKLAESKKVRGVQDIVIKKFSKIEDIKKCHILYVGNDKIGQLNALVSSINYNTLIVTEQDGAAKKGAAINFTVIGNKQNFEINKNNLNKNGLNVSSSLLSLAILVE
jgi:hypothetical protein